MKWWSHLRADHLRTGKRRTRTASDDSAGDVHVGDLDLFRSINPFLATAYVSSQYGGASDRDALYVAGYTRDGQALRYQTLVAPCGYSQDCDHAALRAASAGKVVVGGATDG